MEGRSDDKLILLTAEGPVPLRFLERAGILFLLGKDPDVEWPVALLRDGCGQVVLRGRVAPVRAELVADLAARQERIADMRAKYGGRRFDEWFSRPGRLVALYPDPAPGTAAQNYERWLSSEFDAIAAEYEPRLRANPIERWSRRLSVEFLRTRLAHARRLLEVGPGVGVETVPLLQEGHLVTAIDLSGEMLRRLEARAADRHLESALETRRLAAREVGQLSPPGAPPSFDGGFSTFGALNCEPDLPRVAHALARLLVPGAPFVLGVFNSHAVVELALGLVSLDRRRALARLRSPVPVGSSRFGVDFYPWSVAQIESAFGEAFRIEEVRSFPVLLPPADRALRWAWMVDRFPILVELDSRLGRRRPWSDLGDHLWVTLVRNERS